jgi:two-component system, OmpR family, sensor histidine kinase QseC
MDFDVQGFASIRIDGEPWRAFALWNAAHTMQVQIAQRQQVRVALQREALVRLVAGFVALLVAATLLIWWIVGASIRPLRETAASVALRSEHDLGAVDARWTPREVRPLLDALNRLLARIRSALATERRFTSDAAHELRTPLAAIRANAQVLLGARDTEERDRTARDLLESVDRGSRLVDQLLALARADRPGEGLHFADVDLASLALEQEHAHGKAAARLGVQLASFCDPAPVRGDPGLLAVMMRNLLDNALRYSPRGGRVKVKTGRTAHGVEFTVDDEGPGIAPENREKVFERFFRVPGSVASGSGLGLSIVQRIVEIHRGHITVEEGEGGRGTRMRVTFESASGHGDLRGETAEGGSGIAPGLEPHLRRQA